MFRNLAVGIIAAAAAATSLAVPAVAFTPAVSGVGVGDVISVVLQGSAFDTTAGNVAIDNLSGGQHLSFAYTGSVFEVLGVAIAPRWDYAPGTSSGHVDAAAGTISGVAFAAFPATTDDAFDIATFTLRVLTPGAGTLALVSGQFVGKVGGVAGQTIAPQLGALTLDVSAVPEPRQTLLLMLGLGVLIGARQLRGAGRR